MRPAPLLVVACSALVGIACGIGAGLLMGDTTTYADPLALGVPLHNRACTDESLVVLAWGDKRAPLAAGVQEDPGHASYLATSQSCKTAWTRNGHGTPRYVAYVGPFGTGADACRVGMTAQYKGDLVTGLRSGNTNPVECTCYLPAASMPQLRSGMTVSVVDGMWIRSLQRILSDLGYLPRDRITGYYDQSTIDAVKQFQSVRGGIKPNGVVGSDTWGSLITKGCRLYDS